MCGIIAYLGENCHTNLLNGLAQLQNRGYDSAGICILPNIEQNSLQECSDHVSNHFMLIKHAIKPKETAIEKLTRKITEDPRFQATDSTVVAGIAHTRWATHGPKTDNNSHPHVSSDGKFVIVHNGIIENYKVIKGRLLQQGYTFQSQTDSEVIVNLLAYEYSRTYRDVTLAIKTTFAQLEGTWGIAILCVDTPNTMYCSRHGSPLLVSVNDAFGIVVSEQSGFCGKVENYYVLNNNDLCILTNTNGQIQITTDEIYEPKQVTIQNNSLTPAPYPHWTLKEIYEQADSALRAISLGGRIDKNEKAKLGGLDDNKNVLNKITNVVLLGCGTSHYAGLLGSHYLKDLCHFSYVLNIDAAEFTENDIPKTGKTVFILLSQSGETKDLHNCIEIGKRHNIFMIGVVNVVDSMIAREVNCGCYLNAGREVAVASTKSFTSQVLILSMIAIWFAQLKKINAEKRKTYIDDLRKCHTDIKTMLDDGALLSQIQASTQMFSMHSSCFILGKGKAEAIAKEAALKIKELSRIHAEGFSISSLKHGPFALLEENFPVVLIAPDNAEYAKVENAYHELETRHAKILFITNKKDSDHPNTVRVPENRTYGELLAVIPLQLLSYYLATDREINPDMPKNLAKVVTVE